MIKTFAHHTPSPAGLAKIRKLREAFSVLYAAIDESAPICREKSVAFTHLDTTAMWAIKAIVLNDPESRIEE